MKGSYVIALTALAMSTAFADEMSKGSSASMQRADSGVMNTSALPMIDSNNWYFFGDALCWQALEDGTTWAYVSTDKGGVVTEEHFRNLNFEWEWGFRVGIGGALMNHDEWDMNLYYTWFRTEQEATAGAKGTGSSRGFATAPGRIAPVYQFPPVTSPAPGGFESGEIHWKIFYSMFDWDLGRNYYVSKHLALRPHVGIKGGWIHQKMHGHWKVDATLGNTPYETHNNFWGVGPSAGLNSKWVLGGVGTHMFSLLGDVGGALMYGHWNLKSHWNNVADVQELENMSRSLGATMLQGFMGFGWETNFNADQCHFMAKLGYELQYWFRQNQFFNVTSFDFANKDLMFQGGTLEFRFDF